MHFKAKLKNLDLLIETQNVSLPSHVSFGKAKGLCGHLNQHYSWTKLILCSIESFGLFENRTYRLHVVGNANYKNIGKR